MDAPKSNFGAPEEGGRKWYCVPRFRRRFALGTPEVPNANDRGEMP